MNSECSGYCNKCRGMMWSFLGVLLVLNAFIWPKWNGIDGWFGFIGLLLMFAGVWKAYVTGCSCPKDNACCKHEEKSTHAEAHHELPAVHHEAPVFHHNLPPVHKGVSRHAKKRKN